MPLGGLSTAVTRSRFSTYEYRCKYGAMQDSGYGLPRILLPLTPLNKALLVRLLALRKPIGAQPQLDVRRLQRLPDHAHEFVVQRLQVGFIPEPGGEGFEGLGSIILPTIEAPIYEALYATP
jgi:hypothetical protein